MTNREYLRTLSNEKLADWLYDEWLNHTQYRWSSSRGGFIIYLEEEREPYQCICYKENEC